MKLIRYSRAGSMLRLGVINGDRAVAAEVPWPVGKQTPRRQAHGDTRFN
jgi:hypothetical protein